MHSKVDWAWTAQVKAIAQLLIASAWIRLIEHELLYSIWIVFNAWLFVNQPTLVLFYSSWGNWLLILYVMVIL